MDSPEKNLIQTYRYDNSKYTKIILCYHATFFATCIWKFPEIQFWPPNLYSYMMLLFHVWKPGIYCQPPKINSLAKITIFIYTTVIFQLIATDNFYFGTSVKCQRHSNIFTEAHILVYKWP